MSAQSRAYIGLGSNLDRPAAQLDAAASALSRVPRTRLAAVSRYYQSLPWGDPDQPDYVNAVAAIDTGLAPEELLAELLEIELRHGRERSAARRNGPRTLDLDLLWYAGLVRASPQLTLPHPRMAERPFVLLPLAELAPALAIAGHGPVKSLLKPEFASLCWPLAHSPPALPPSG